MRELHGLTPQAWLHDQLEPYLARNADPRGRGRWLGLQELLDNDASALRAAHRRLVGDGAPRPAAAKYLVGWTAGALAAPVGFLLGVAAAGLLVDASRVRWRLQDGGWVDRIAFDAPPTLVVAPGHPWSQATATSSKASDQAVECLVQAVEPLVAACHGLAKVGRTSLWNEVADSLGMALTHGTAQPVDLDAVRRVEGALRTPGVPWRRRPTIGVATTDRGPLYVAQKGGCCLAYLSGDVATPALEDLDPQYRRFLQRFPLVPGAPAYCATCCLRDPADSLARQTFWHELG